jgi:glycosyltransferase involved in cell wall biosynthesis
VKPSRTPRISVGLPVYNGARYVGRAIESLLAQTCTDFELIVCDNASTDATANNARGYADQDPRVRYYRNVRNMGVGYNHRRAFELARGEYFRWAGADDLVEPSLLEACATALDSHPSAVLAYPRTRLIDAGGTVVQEYDDRLSLPWPDPVRRLRTLLDVVRRCNAMYGLVRSDVLRRTSVMGDFIGADVCLLAELALHGTFVELPEFLFLKRTHAESIAGSSRDLTRVHRAYLPDARRDALMPAWRHQFEHYRAVGRAPLRVGEKARAYAFLAHNVIMRRRRLAREVTGAVAQLLRFS